MLLLVVYTNKPIKPVGTGDTQDTTVTLTKITIGKDERTIVAIVAEMDFGATTEATVKVEVVKFPRDAVVAYKPELKDGFWELELNARNALGISVKAKEQATPTVYKAKIKHKVEEGFGKKVNKDIINHIHYYPASINSDFVMEDGDQLFDEVTTWKNPYDNKARDFYGAKKLTMSLYTKVATTKVFGRKILLFWDKTESGEQIEKK